MTKAQILEELALLGDKITVFESKDGEHITVFCEEDLDKCDRIAVYTVYNKLLEEADSVIQDAYMADYFHFGDLTLESYIE